MLEFVLWMIEFMPWVVGAFIAIVIVEACYNGGINAKR